MNKKHLVVATLVALTGLYVGCTNPGTIVDTAKNTADPRVPAGNATSSTFSKTNISGVWMRIESNENQAEQMVFRQDSSGNVSGIVHGNVVKVGRYENGHLTFTSNPGGSSVIWDGVVSEDGGSMVLKFDDHTYSATGSYACTRLY